MEFNLVHLTLDIRSEDIRRLALWLPLQGNAFAAVCRSLVCLRPEHSCGTCPQQGSCTWHLLFSQQLSSDPSGLKRHQKPPLPFILSFPLSAVDPHMMECRLVVIGRVIPQIDLLLEGFDVLLSGGLCPLQAEIVRVGSLDYQGNHSLYRDSSGKVLPDNLAVLSARGLADGYPAGVCTLQVRLLSPLRIVHDGHISLQFDFSRFARSLLRRVSSLAYYYGDGETDSDFRELSLQADAVRCSEDRFVAVAGGNRKLSGVTGSGSFTGDFSGIMPFLAAGTYVNAGKGASFGMGAYELHSGALPVPAASMTVRKQA